MGRPLGRSPAATGRLPGGGGPSRPMGGPMGVPVGGTRRPLGPGGLGGPGGVTLKCEGGFRVRPGGRRFLLPNGRPGGRPCPPDPTQAMMGRTPTQTAPPIGGGAKPAAYGKPTTKPPAYGRKK